MIQDSSIISNAKEVLFLESNGILNIINLLDVNFVEVVKLILESKGRVIFTGIGKSAHICQKLVATFNSTGTPAIFMHTAEAIHGDLGMIQSEDIVIFISKSGNTPEVKTLVPSLKVLCKKLVALVGNTEGYLAKNSDYILNATIEKEACPHDLAPTVSSTAALALGDALAVCLLKIRGFTSENFAKYHPGGALGKRLYIKVSDLMKPFPFVLENVILKNVIIEMSKGKMGCVLVFSNDNELKGIITDGDIRRLLEKTFDLNGIIAKDLITNMPKGIDNQQLAYDCLLKMEEYKVSQLVVFKNDLPCGIIHIHDILNEGIR